MTFLLRAPAAILAIVALAGCHSACFQTARIKDGVTATAGVTTVRSGKNTGVSDQSILLKAEIGHEAYRKDVGYSLALTLVSPFKAKEHNVPEAGEIDAGAFPDETAGVMPEVKVQFPRATALDFALDLRLITYIPERLSLISSVSLDEVVAPDGRISHARWLGRPATRILRHLTPYASFSYVGTIGCLAVAGTEISMSSHVGLCVEYSRWLSVHNYPDDYPGPARRYPYSFGLALTYHLPRESKRPAAPDLAGNPAPPGGTPGYGARVE